MDLTLVVPARAGSSRLVDKNILPFCGLPLAAWSALQASRLDATRVIVSSDSEAYLSIISEALEGNRDASDIEFVRRNSDEASSTAKIFDVLKNWVRRDFITTEWLGLLLPTAPIRNLQDLEALLQASLTDNRARFSCVPYEFPIEFAFSISSHGDDRRWQARVDDSPMKTGKTQSNSLLPAFHPTGTLFVGQTEHYSTSRTSFYSGALPHIVSSISRFDIDTGEDFRLTESVAQACQLDVNSPFVQGFRK